MITPKSSSRAIQKPIVNLDSLNVENFIPIECDSPFKKQEPLISKMSLVRAPAPPPMTATIPNKIGEKQNVQGTDLNIDVLGVMPPDVAILRLGNKTYSVSAGSESPVGKIGKVTEEGVFINGSLVKLSEKKVFVNYES